MPDWKNFKITVETLASTMDMLPLLNSEYNCRIEKHGSTNLFDQLYASLNSGSSKHIPKLHEESKNVACVWKDLLIWMDGKHKRTNTNIDSERHLLTLYLSENNYSRSFVSDDFESLKTILEHGNETFEEYIQDFVDKIDLIETSGDSNTSI